MQQMRNQLDHDSIELNDTRDNIVLLLPVIFVFLSAFFFQIWYLV